MTASDQISSVSLTRELWRFVRDLLRFSRSMNAAALVLIGLGAVLEGFSLVLLVPLLSIVIGSGVPAGRLSNAIIEVFALFELKRPVDQLILLFVVFGALMILRAVVLYLRDVTVAKLQMSFVESHRLRVAKSLASAQWDQVVRLRHARITQLIGEDIQRIGVAAFVFLRCVVALIMLLVQCCLVFILAPILAGVALGILIVSALALAPTIRRAYALGRVLTDSNLSLLDATAQFLGGLKLALSQNLQKSFVLELQENLHELSTRQLAFVRQQTNNRLVLSTAMAFAGGLLVLVGFGVFNIAPATLITLLLILARMGGPASQIQQGVQQLAQALPIYRKATTLEQELASIPKNVGEPAGAIALPDGPVNFENVSYSHLSIDSDGSSARGVRELNLEIQPGSFTGIAGPSGAGKTTFADLLVGLYPPEQGRILVAGCPLTEGVLASWRERISYISQDPFLFHDTIRRNLAWAAPEATEADMWNALDLVGASELVSRTQLGLEMVVGERGTVLSGGERQRIALARAILRQPRLLVLDEVTSAIDVVGEREILERIRALKPRPAVVIVAHRVESLALCDHIVHFENGRCRVNAAR